MKPISRNFREIDFTKKLPSINDISHFFHNFRAPVLYHRIPYPGLSNALIGATEPIFGKFLDPKLDEFYDDLLTLKCDVCVLSEFNQVFKLVDGILETDLWSTEENLEEEVEDKSENSLEDENCLEDQDVEVLESEVEDDITTQSAE